VCCRLVAAYRTVASSRAPSLTGAPPYPIIRPKPPVAATKVYDNMRFYTLVLSAVLAALVVHCGGAGGGSTCTADRDCGTTGHRCFSGTCRQPCPASAECDGNCDTEGLFGDGEPTECWCTCEAGVQCIDHVCGGAEVPKCVGDCTQNDCGTITGSDGAPCDCGDCGGHPELCVDNECHYGAACALTVTPDLTFIQPSTYVTDHFECSVGVGSGVLLQASNLAPDTADNHVFVGDTEVPIDELFDDPNNPGGAVKIVLFTVPAGLADGVVTLRTCAGPSPQTFLHYAANAAPAAPCSGLSPAAGPAYTTVTLETPDSSAVTGAVFAQGGTLNQVGVTVLDATHVTVQSPSQLVAGDELVFLGSVGGWGRCPGWFTGQ